MSDLNLNSSGDLDLTNGRLSLITTEQSLTSQRLLIKLRTYRGEWYLDLSEGVPYFQRILRRGSSAKTVADSIFRGVINNDPNISSVTSFSSTLNNSGLYSLSFGAVTTTGEIVTVQQDIEF